MTTGEIINHHKYSIAFDGRGNNSSGAYELHATGCAHLNLAKFQENSWEWAGTTIEEVTADFEQYDGMFIHKVLPCAKKVGK